MARPAERQAFRALQAGHEREQGSGCPMAAPLLQLLQLLPFPLRPRIVRPAKRSRRVGIKQLKQVKQGKQGQVATGTATRPCFARSAGSRSRSGSPAMPTPAPAPAPAPGTRTLIASDDRHPGTPSPSSPSWQGRCAVAAEVGKRGCRRRGSSLRCAANPVPATPALPRSPAVRHVASTLRVAFLEQEGPARGQPGSQPPMIARRCRQLPIG